MSGVADADDDDEDDETWLHFMDMLERLSVSLYTSIFFSFFVYSFYFLVDTLIGIDV